MVICKHSGAEVDWMFVPDGNYGSAYIVKDKKESLVGEIKSNKTSEGWIFVITNTHQGQKETLTWNVNLKNKSGIFKMNLVGKTEERKVKCSDKH